MIDIKLIRDQPEKIEDNIKKRNPEYSQMLKDLIKIDERRLKILKQVEELRYERNILTKEISDLKLKNKPVARKLEHVKELPLKIKGLESELDALSLTHKEILLRLPNILQEDVPIGTSDDDNKEVRKFGKINRNFTPKDHIDIGTNLGLIDIERAAKIAGSRFFFLNGDLAMLEVALMKAAIDFITKKGFILTIPPFMMRRASYEGVIAMQDFEDVLYKIDGEDLYMIATSEHPIVAQHSGETISNTMKYAGLSTNFRKEAGSHGKDTKGIFRVHQFSKIEQIALCHADQSNILHNELLKNAEEFLEKLGIPFRVVELCSSEVGRTASKQYDIEAWFPSQQRYREVVSCSNCTDYQARRLNIKYNENADKNAFAHTVNSTLVTDRTLVAIIENFQQEDGTILIPDILQSYMNGLKKIG